LFELKEERRRRGSAEEKEIINERKRKQAGGKVSINLNYGFGKGDFIPHSLPARLHYLSGSSHS